jgi:hypothetical protein
VRHVGSACDEAELGLLVEQARRLLEDEDQGVLELGLTPATRKVTMLAPLGQAALFAQESMSSPRHVVGRPRVLRDEFGGVVRRVGRGVFGPGV